MLAEMQHLPILDRWAREEGDSHTLTRKQQGTEKVGRNEKNNNLSVKGRAGAIPGRAHLG